LDLVGVWVRFDGKPTRFWGSTSAILPLSSATAWSCASTPWEWPSSAC